MRLLRPLLALSALAAAVSTGPAQARVVRPVELTSSTVVTATHSGYLDVVLPSDATLSPKFQNNPDIGLSGAGRFVGLWLERQGDPANGSSEGLEVMRLPSFLGGSVLVSGSAVPQGTCTGVPNDQVALTHDCRYTDPTALLLHEGNYRLRVLTDGHPLTFTLTLHGLDAGTTEVSPTHSLASGEKALPQRDGLQDKLVTFGTTASVPGNVDGFVMSTVMASSTPVWKEQSVCERIDSGEPPALAYGPHCPQGRGGAYSYELVLGGRTFGGVGGFASAGGPTGLLGLGGSWGNSDGVTLGQTLGVWLESPDS
jgi:hypothetical protein